MVKSNKKNIINHRSVINPFSFLIFTFMTNQFSLDNDIPVNNNGLVHLDHRIVILICQRPNVLRSLHSVLQGKVAMKARANGSIYWPGMNVSIRNTRASCMFCIKIAPSQTKKPINLTKSPDWPFQQIVRDLSNVGNHGYLACADRLTGWLILYHQSHRQANASRLISICRDIFEAMAPLKI